MSVQLRLGDDEEPENNVMLLRLEPDNGGDHQLRASQNTVIEQVKMRARHRSWSASDIAREVFPDLLKAVSLEDTQLFRLVTDNGLGTEELSRFVRYLKSAETSEFVPQFKWGHQKISADQFLEKLAKAANVDSGDPKFRRLLQNFDAEIIDTASAENEVDHLLSLMLGPDQEAKDKREEIAGRMLKAASKGQTLSESDFMNMVGPDAKLRLDHARNLPDILKAKLQSDLTVLGYDPSKQARIEPYVSLEPITVLSGESGQGKTWSLSQSAQSQMQNGELAIAFRAPTNFDGVVSEINERVWLPAYGRNASIPEIARRLMPATGTQDGIWLTVYVDDLQDRDLARKLASYDWTAAGIRLVISCQPRITEEISNCQNSAKIHQIDNFTSAELRRYLRYHSRDTPLETMPDDVFELLLKPIHAKIFVELPERTEWVDCTEYELIKRYWGFATRQVHEQGDHPNDAPRLTTLAGQLLGDTPRYPWTLQDVQNANLDDAALQRLEKVGLVWWPEPDRFAFRSDRLLNWAVAERLCTRIVNEQWTAEQVDAELERIDSIKSAKNDPIGRRLGYVMLDTIWLLSNELSPKFVADVLLAQMHRLPQEWRQETMWSLHISTIGTRLLPVLEDLALRSYDEETDWDIPRNIHFAIAAIATEDADAVIDAIERLLASDNASAINVALKSACTVSATRLLDRLWDIHSQRATELDEYRADPDRGDRSIELMGRRDISSKALKMAAAAKLGWLEDKIKTTSEGQYLEHLLWVLCDRDILENQVTADIWARQKDHFRSTLAQDSVAMIHALKHFADFDNHKWLNGVPIRRENAIDDRVLSSRAQLDPNAALEQIRQREEDYGWSASNWWLPELARTHPKEVANAILENAQKGDNPLTDVILFYAHFPELMGEKTLEWVLDQFADRLTKFNHEHSADPDHQTDRLGHPLSFLPKLVHPWQFDCVAKRAGTVLEDELVRFATARSGRSSRNRDLQGQECERILAMMAGDGFDALVVSELNRTDQMGREDGYTASQWTEAGSVTDALYSADSVADGGYGQVQQMEALAVHQLDGKLEEMVTGGAPIYVNAAMMRSADGRPTGDLKQRVNKLIADGNRDEIHDAVRLAGFLKNAQDAAILLPVFCDPAFDDEVKRSIIGTFRALQFYNPQVLAIAKGLMHDRYDDDGKFVAGFLASYGDAEARTAVTEWLGSTPTNTWSSSNYAFIQPLLAHGDSRPATLHLLRKARGDGGLLIDAFYARKLAEEGDKPAQSELWKQAYRAPRFGGGHTAEAIRFLQSVDPDEAFFAARRYFARHKETAAINLMLDINREEAVPILVAAFRSAKSSLQAEIARRLRTCLSADQILGLLSPLATANSVSERRLAADLAGWMPANVELPWLANLIQDSSITVKTAAEEAIRKRTLEAAASGHLEAMKASAKPLQWARMQTIFQCADPYFLWSRTDPISLGALLDTLPPEFAVEARQMHRQRSKKVSDELKRADRDRI